MVERKVITRICQKCGGYNEVYLKANGKPIGRCNICRRLSLIGCRKKYNEKYKLEHSNKRKVHYLSNRDRLRNVSNEKAMLYKPRRAELDKARRADPIKKASLSKYNRQYRKGKYVKDVNFKLSIRLRGRIVDAIKNGQKSGSAIRDLGCTVSYLKILESKFASGMTWDNWCLGGWHIDNITPVSAFNLENRNEFLKACHYSNLQPLWCADNLSKGSKYEILN